MASTIKADTLQSTTSNVFVLNSAGTEYARFDSSGNLGIGTNGSPSTQNGGVSLAVGLKGSQNLNLGFETNTLQNGGNLEFRRTGRTGSARYGQISGAEDNSGNGFLVFYASAVGADVTERVRINPFGIGLGVVPSSGTGIMFPATQNASADANTLDDYEEGTWTPAITFGGGSTGITYSAQLGFYTKIGNTVTVQFRVNLSSKGSSTGSAALGGLPFISGGTYSFNYVIHDNSAGFSAGYGLYWSVESGNTSGSLRQIGTNGSNALDNTNFNNNTFVSGILTYRV